VTFLFPDKSKKKVDLMVHDEYFIAALDAEQMEEFTAVALKIKGKSQIGRFKYNAEENHHGEEEDHHEDKEDHHEKKKKSKDDHKHESLGRA